MKVFTIFALPLVSILLLSTFPDTAMSGDFYKWVDEKGVVHFVDSPGKIPTKYQKRAKEKEFKKSTDESSVLEESVKVEPTSSDWIKEAKKSRRYPTKGGAIDFVNSDSFKSEVLYSNQPVLVEFWATWCGYCKKIEPTIVQIATEYDGRLRIVKVDIDKDKNLKARYKVKGVPTVVLFKNGKEKKRVRGFANKKRLVAMIEKGLN